MLLTLTVVTLLLASEPLAGSIRKELSEAFAVQAMEPA